MHSYKNVWIRAVYPSSILLSRGRTRGPDGPYRSKKAYDLLVQCETGLVLSTGTPDVPAKAGVSIADIATGMYARTAASSLGALLDVPVPDLHGGEGLPLLWHWIYRLDRPAQADCGADVHGRQTATGTLRSLDG